MNKAQKAKVDKKSKEQEQEQEQAKQRRSSQIKRRASVTRTRTRRVKKVPGKKDRSTKKKEAERVRRSMADNVIEEDYYSQYYGSDETEQEAEEERIEL